MFKATLTGQGQITIPAELRKRMGVRSGDRLNFVIKRNEIIVSKATGWESLRGVLSEFKGDYPTKKQLAQAHISALGLKPKNDGENTRRHKHFAQIPG